LSAVSKPGGAASQGEITIKVYPLTGVAAWSAVQSVRDLLANQPRGAQARAVRTAMAFTLKGPDGEEVKGAVDPARVRITSDPGGTSLIVAAPAEAIPMIDRFIELIDQSPTRNLPSIRRYTLRHAQASDLSGTMQRLFDAQRQGAVGWREGATRPQFLADVRTNTILVTASEAQHAEVTRLVASMDESVEGQASGLKTTVIALERAEPAAVRQLVESLLIGRDAAKRERVRIGVEEGSGLMIVRAGDDDLAEVQRLVKEIEGAMTPLAGENGAAPAQVRAGVRAVRTLKVERADAQAVASTVQKFLSDRAQSASRGGRRNVERLAVIGDRRSGTIAVWATEPEFVEVQSLVATLDLPARNKQSEFRVIALKHARTTDIDETIRAISWEMQWERMTGVRARGGAEGPAEEQLLIETNDRTNSVVLFGQGEALELASKIIAELDVADPATERPVIRAVGVPKGDLNVLAGVVRETMRTPGWYEWRGPDPQGVRVEVDAKQRKLVLVGKAARVEEATGMLRSLAPEQAATGPVVESITLKHAQAWRASDSLRRFFAERAQAMGLPEPMVSAIGSNDGNMVILSATGDSAESELKLARELLSKLDQPELGENRRVDLFALRNAKADEAIRAVQAMFPASGRSDDRVLVTTVGGGQSLAISTPADKFEQVEGLLKLIDAPPKASDAKIATVKLKTARASEVAQALAGALPASLSVKVTPVVRNNTLLLTGSDEAVGLVMERIAAIDDQPVVSLEFRRVALKHAVADDAVYTLRRLLQSRPRNAGDPEAAVDYSMLDNTVLFSGTPEQLKDIEQMLASLDVASTKPPRTEFVKLEFAKAEPVADALKVFYGRYALGRQDAGLAECDDRS
jgi:type II secretory pathway component GspD/PulD (secretin)